MKENPFKLRLMEKEDLQAAVPLETEVKHASDIPEENILEEDSAQHLNRVSEVLGLDPPAASSTELIQRLSGSPEKKAAYLAIQEAIIRIREYEYFARRN